MYTYIITEDLIVNIYDENGNLVDYPGPYISIEAATESAKTIVNGLNSGLILDPREKGDT
jgi:hypothetical protein